MLKNYLKIAFRNILRHKGSSSINILGLAVGIASFALIFSYVSYQYSFDKYNRNIDRIYRLTSETRFSANAPYVGYAQVGAGIARLMTSQYPEVSEVVRMCWLGSRYVDVKGQH